MKGIRRKSRVEYVRPGGTSKQAKDGNDDANDPPNDFEDLPPSKVILDVADVCVWSRHLWHSGCCIVLVMRAILGLCAMMLMVGCLEMEWKSIHMVWDEMEWRKVVTQCQKVVLYSFRDA